MSYLRELRVVVCLLCWGIFVGLVSLQKEVASIDLDAQERNRTATMKSMESLRKGWVKDAFEQFDIYACEHMFYPFLLMATTGNALLSILSAYVYESYSAFQFYVLDVDDPYFIRVTDALIQDPVQAACATLIAYLIYTPARVVPSRKTMGYLLLMLAIERDWIPFGLEGIASIDYSDYPVTKSYVSTIPVLLLLTTVVSYVWKSDWSVNVRRAWFGYVLIFVSQALGYSERKSQQPLPSSLMWFMLLGSACGVIVFVRKNYDVKELSRPLKSVGIVNYRELEQRTIKL